MRKTGYFWMMIVILSLALGACRQADVDVDALSTIATLTAEANQTQEQPEPTAAAAGTPTSTRIDSLSETALPSPDLGAPARLSRLPGVEVRAPSGEILGTARDLILNLTQREAVYVVFESAGLFGMGDENIVLPWEALTVDLGENFSDLLFYARVDPEVIASAPVLAAEPEPDFLDPAWDAHIRQYWEPVLIDLRPTPTPGAQAADPASPVVSFGLPLLGLPVNLAREDEVGKIEEVLFDLETGEVQYLVVSAGGVLGIGEKWIPTPVSYFQLEAGRESFLLLADRQRLTEAPNYDLAQLPDASDPGWDAEIWEYWQQ